MNTTYSILGQTFRGLEGMEGVLLRLIRKLFGLKTLGSITTAVALYKFRMKTKVFCCVIGKPPFVRNSYLIRDDYIRQSIITWMCGILDVPNEKMIF